VRPAPRQHFPASGSSHARTEPVTTLAHNLARLVGALHGMSLREKAKKSLEKASSF
jgi:hypothetical protein